MNFQAIVQSATVILGLFGATAALGAAKLDTYPQMTSQFVQPRDVTVWVPDACQSAACPVLYMQDGQTLYDPKLSLSGASWGMADTLTKLIDTKAVPAVIVVGIYNTDKRGREYLPQKIYDRMPADARVRMAKNWGGEPLSDQYLNFMVTELKPFIDKTYKTLPDPAHTYVMGSSMGGLIAFYAQAQYPDVFGASASLSMHWLLDNPWVNIPDAKTNQPEVTAALAGYVASTGLKPGVNRVYIDQGTQTLDANYRPYSLAFEKTMHDQGWTTPDFSSQIFPGEAHSEGAWAKRLDIPLKFLLAGKVAKSGTLIRLPAMPSHDVQPRDVQVWLPEGYDPARAYKVVYMMDGQNIFDPSPYAGVDWGVMDTLPGLIHDGKVPPAIVVAVDNIPERTREYMPQRVYDLLPADYQARVRDFEDGAVPNSDAFLKFLVTELKPAIDATYHTISGPEGTSIIGSSSGGHIALYAQGQYPKVFGASASLSMPWLMASPAKDDIHIQADTAVLTTAWRLWLQDSGMTPGHNRIYSDQGTVGLDGLFTPYDTAITAMMRAHGWNETDFASPIYDGAQHSEKDWRKRIAIPLTFVLDH